MPAEMRPTSIEDALVVSAFAVEFQGKLTGVFRECSAFGSEHEVVVHQGSDAKGKQVTQKQPGNLKFAPITLKQGVTTDLQFWKWYEEVETGKIATARKDGTITMYDDKGQPIAKWNFLKAWPSKVVAPSFDASSNEVAIEEITIVYEDYKRDQ
jgi:phage tail-like protein